MGGIRYKGQIFSGTASFGSAEDISVNDGSGQTTDTQTMIRRILGDFAEIESSATASKAYVAGEYLVLNGYFYKVTNSIAIGDAFIEGTNVEKTTVASEASDLAHPAWSAITDKPDLTHPAWGNITDKPTSFTPSSHTHDDRYYTESEITTNLNTVTSGTVTTSISLGSNGSNKVWKLGKMLYVNARTYNTSKGKSVTAGNAVFTLPSGFRPSDSRAVPAILTTASYNAIGSLGYATVASNGTVSVPVTATYYHIWVVGAFPM